jgi:ABC-2 type transport system permease protein
VLPVDGRLFGQFLGQQVIFNLIVTIFGGAGLVANDLRTGAILVYLSRPLTRRDYVLGKLGVVMALNLAVTLAPALVLYAVGVGLAPEQFFTWSLAWVPPAIVLQSVAASLVLSLVALAVSSLSRSARVAGIGFFGLLLGLDLVRNILRVLYRRPETALLSLQGNLEAVGRALFDVPARGGLEIHWAWPALVLAAVSVSAMFILRARVRAVEIVR